MADRTEAKFDFSGVQAMFDQLKGPVRMSLARSMAVAGGKVIRDEAKLRAPRGTESKAPGTLRDAIYLAFRDKQSSATQAVYSVTWNARKAPHGHLIEFGHWRYNKIVNGRPQKSLLGGRKKGRGPQDHGGRGALKVPVWVSAKPFLRPAFDAAAQRAMQAMIARGRVRLPELLAEQKGAGPVGGDE